MSLIGSFGIVVDGVAVLHKLVRDVADVLRLQTLAGNVDYDGDWSDAPIVTVHKLGAAERRLIDRGALRRGFANYVPVEHLAAAGTRVQIIGIGDFLQSRLDSDWLSDDARLTHELLLAEVREIEAQEVAQAA